MSYETVIKGGTIFTPDDSFVGDLAINGEKITAVSQDSLSGLYSKFFSYSTATFKCWWFRLQSRVCILDWLLLYLNIIV